MPHNEETILYCVQQPKQHMGPNTYNNVQVGPSTIDKLEVLMWSRLGY